MTPSELRQHLDRQARRLAEQAMTPSEIRQHLAQKRDPTRERCGCRQCEMQRLTELAEAERHELASLRLWAVVTGGVYLVIVVGLVGLAWWWAGGW